MLGRVCCICAIVQWLVLHASSDCENFTCDVSDNKTVIIDRYRFNCYDEYCNRNGKGAKCEPCVKNLCESSFECKGNNSFILSGLHFNCPQNYYCSEENNPECKPCRPNNCDVSKKTYKCIDSKRVILDGFGELKCEVGYVCNEQYLEPCKPCIPEEDFTAKTTTKQPPLNGDPCTADRKANCFSGPGGQYYRCTSFWNGTVVSELRGCGQINMDVKCYNSNVCASYRPNSMWKD